MQSPGEELLSGRGQAQDNPPGKGAKEKVVSQRLPVLALLAKFPDGEAHGLQAPGHCSVCCVRGMLVGGSEATVPAHQGLTHQLSGQP